MSDSVNLNKTRVVGESASSLPADTTPDYSGNADTLFEWLGSFWDTVYEDPYFIKDIQTARAMRVAQLYLDLLENLKLHDRSNAPVFHRERWHPISIRRSYANSGTSGIVKLTSRDTVGHGEKVGEVMIGVQKADAYEPGTVLDIGGGKASYGGIVVYPLDGYSSGLKSVPACICNKIAGSDVVIPLGSGFSILEGSIAIEKSQDPFIGKNADLWPKFEIVNDDGTSDVETVVWACDAMFDKDFIYTSLGYVMGLPGKSSEIYKRVVNAAWNITAQGATPLMVRSLMACICGLPTVKDDGEVVETILDEMDGSKDIITNKNVYVLPPKSELRRNVRRGAKLDRFDTLDKAIRVYACVTDVDRLPTYNDFLDDVDEFVKDVPAIDLPPAFFRTGLSNGFSVNWELQDVVYCGNDVNGNPKLRFSLGGSKSDEDKFWTDTWASYEKEGKSMETCLEGLDYDRIYDVGASWTSIRPIEFFMHNLIGANTLIITVRTDTLAEDAPLYDPRFFGVLRDSIPSYIRLYVIEHSMPGDDNVGVTGAPDEAFEYAYEEYDDKYGYNSGSAGKARYCDGFGSKWVPSCRHDGYRKHLRNNVEDDSDGYDDEY